MNLHISVPHDEEFEQELREVLKKPEGWYDERVERAVKGATRVKRRNIRIPDQG